MWAMKTKTSLLTLALCFAAGTVCLAGPFTGVWILNPAKSKFAPDATKNTVVVYKDAKGGMVKISVDSVDAKGQKGHSEWAGKFDGKDYAVTGDPTSDMRAYTKVDDRTMNFTSKKAGKVVVNGRVAVAADGKSRTVTTSGKDAKGKKVKSTAFYDKK
jgi:hypothetical protein